MGEAFDELLVKGARFFRFQFREAAAKFKMVGVETVPIVVRYGGNDALIERLRVVGPKRDVMRGLQRYVVTVQKGMAAKLKEAGGIEEMQPGVFVQALDSFYSEAFGLDVFRDGPSPEECIL